jgi:general secretion pathway protein K
VFALFAFEVLDVSRGTVGLLHAHQDRAVLAAAIDAGLAQTIYDLGIEDRARRLPVDGLPRVSSFDGAKLIITVADERGKVAINNVGPDVERQLFAAAGVSGDRLDILVDSLEDWKDPDSVSRPHGAELPYYLQFGLKPRDGVIRTIDELGKIRGMDAALLARISPAITVLPSGGAGFNANTAPALAMEAMKGIGNASFDIQKRQQELAGERTALDIADDVPVAGRSLSIRVEAKLSDGSSGAREAVVEFTGNSQQPYWLRSVR